MTQHQNKNNTGPDNIIPEMKFHILQKTDSITNYKKVQTYMYSESSIIQTMVIQHNSLTECTIVLHVEMGL